MNMACVACLRSQADEILVCAVCNGALASLPEGHALPAYEAPAAALAPEAETVVTVTPAPVTTETLPAAERGISDDEAAALLAAARAVDDETDTSAAPLAPAETTTEAVPTPADLGIPTPTTRATPAPVPTTEVIQFPTAQPAAPTADPAPVINNAEVVKALEEQRKRNEVAARAQRQPTSASPVPTPEPTRRPAVESITPPPARRPAPASTKQSWWWLVAAAVLALGVFAWWLLRDHGTDGGSNSESVAAVDDSAAINSAPTSSIDPVARGMARKALSETDRLTTGLGKVGGRVTNLEHAQDGRVLIIGANSSSCEYRSFGACVEGLLATGDQRLVAQGIITLADARASAERTCRATGCGAE